MAPTVPPMRKPLGLKLPVDPSTGSVQLLEPKRATAVDTEIEAGPVVVGGLGRIVVGGGYRRGAGGGRSAASAGDTLNAAATANKIRFMQIPFTI